MRPCTCPNETRTYSSTPTVDAKGRTTTASSSGYNVDALLEKLSSAAQLSAPINYSKTDLLLQTSLGEENVALVAGAQSNLYNEDGGLTIVVQAAPGNGPTVEEALKTLSDRDQDILRTYMMYEDGKKHLPDGVFQHLLKKYNTTPENLRQVKGRSLKKIKDLVLNNKNLQNN